MANRQVKATVEQHQRLPCGESGLERTTNPNALLRGWRFGLKDKMEALHVSAIELLTPHFKLERKPEPLEVVINEPSLPDAKGSLQLRGPNDSVPAYLFISPTRNRSLPEAEITCAHETGHHLHVALFGDYRPIVRNLEYEERELIAIVSCFLFFEKTARLKEMKKVSEHQKSNIDGKREKAVFTTLERLQISMEKALDVVLFPNDHKSDSVGTTWRQIVLHEYYKNFFKIDAYGRAWGP